MTFPRLFQGRMDAYGTDEGGCDKVTDVPDHALQDEYERRIAAHLVGSNLMGVYPLADNLEVTWGCTDLDYTDDPTEAYNLRTLLNAAGINAWVETSRSKGFHVWTFCEEWTPAHLVRDALLAAHQILGIPATEINPKQTSLEGLKGYGNYVRLPYGGARAAEGFTDNGRQMVHHPLTNAPMDLAQFVGMAWGDLTAEATYGKLAAAYKPPPPPKPIHLEGAPVDVTGAIKARMSKGTYLAWFYGPAQDGNHHGRSESLARLGHLCHEDGFTAAECYTIIDTADRKWGKFSVRPDGPHQIERLVVNAYG